MSLARLALRLAAVESLAPVANASTGPWPTAVGPRVYDSRIDSVAAAQSEQEYEDAIAALDNKPLITIYTEDDHSLPYGAQKVFADEQTVTLIAEIMIAAVGKVDYRMPDGTQTTLSVLEAGATDGEREALLDLIDSQVRRVFDQRNYLAPLMTMVAMELHSIHDDPQRDAHRTARLALRTVKFHTKVKKEMWPEIGEAAQTGLDALPSPLRDVAKGLQANSSAGKICNFVAGAIAAPPALPPLLQGIRIFTMFGRGVRTPPSATDLAAATFGPPASIAADVYAATGRVF